MNNGGNMDFTKMQGAGNDFVFIENFNNSISEAEYSPLALKLCDRRFGIGADGLVILCPPRSYGNVKMEFFNADGTRGETCGNGVRCVTRYCIEHGLSEEKTVTIETTAGISTGEETGCGEYTVKLNDPCNFRRIDENTCYVELGNPGIPHAIVHREGWTAEDRDKLRTEGRRWRYDERFPKGANVTFWQQNSDSVDCITFERGVEDFTLACGTGAGSTTYVMHKLGFCGEECILRFPGGVLRVNLKDGIFLSGPAEVSFTGTV